MMKTAARLAIVGVVALAGVGCAHDEDTNVDSDTQPGGEGKADDASLPLPGTGLDFGNVSCDAESVKRTIRDHSPFYSNRYGGTTACADPVWSQSSGERYVRCTTSAVVSNSFATWYMNDIAFYFCDSHRFWQKEGRVVGSIAGTTDLVCDTNNIVTTSGSDVLGGACYTAMRADGRIVGTGCLEKVRLLTKTGKSIVGTSGIPNSYGYKLVVFEENRVVNVPNTTHPSGLPADMRVPLI